MFKGSVNPLPWFIEHRPEIFNFVKDLSNVNTHILIVAPVKSGKREIMEIFSRMINSGTGCKTKHIYLSALNRKDDKDQLEELMAYGFSVHIAKSASTKLIAEIDNDAGRHDKFMIHFNESDYGTGSKQLLSTVLPELISRSNVQIVAYSATQHEAISSKFSEFCKIVEFDPPPAYRGTKWYLDTDRVIEAEPFWDNENEKLTNQGIKCCDRLKNSDKIFGVVRFPYDMEKIRQGKKFEREIAQKYGFTVRFINARDPYNWGGGPEASWFGSVVLNDKTILVVCQTVTRSTEVKFHRYISFWHGAERTDTAYNTIIQADGRPIFYDTPENNPPDNPVDIIIYTSVDAFKVNAGYMDVDDYDKKLSGRMSVLKSKKYKYILVETNTRPDKKTYDAIVKLNGGNIFSKNPQCLSISEYNSRDLAEESLRDIDPIVTSVYPDRGAYIYCDSPTTYTDSWQKYVVDKGRVGKYVIMVQQNEEQDNSHLTKDNSLFQRL